MSPIYGDRGFLDLPNLFVEGFYLLEEELNNASSGRESQDTTGHSS